MLGKNIKLILKNGKGKIEMASVGQYNRKNMIEAIKEHARGHIAKHAMNVEVYLSNSRCWRTS